MIEEKDLYEVLGLTPAASPEQIKTAFRGLAQKLHPDLSQKSDHNDVALFVAITEAYEILSDPDKRNEYNKNRGFEHYEELKIAGAGFEKHYEGVEAGSKVDLSAERITTASVFNNLSGNEDINGLRIGQKASIELAENPQEAELEEVGAWGEEPAVNKSQSKKSIFNFGSKVSSKVNQILGMGSAMHLKRIQLKDTLKSRMSEDPDRDSYVPSKKPKNPNITKAESRSSNPTILRGERIYGFQISKLEALVGTTRKLALEGRDGQPVMRDVNIPAGTCDGQILEVSWGWERAKIKVNISLEPLWDIRGSDIFLRLPVTLEEVIEGAELSVPCFGGQCRIKLSSGMNLLEPIRIEAKGIKRKGRLGDLVVLVCVVPPQGDSPTLRAAAQALEGSYSGDVREDLLSLIENPVWFWSDEIRSYMHLPITFSEALWGSNIKISLEGSELEINVPRGCNPETVIQVDFDDYALSILPIVVLPKQMDLNTKAAAKAISQHYNAPVRKSLPKKFSVE